MRDSQHTWLGSNIAISGTEEQRNRNCFKQRITARMAPFLSFTYLPPLELFPPPHIDVGIRYFTKPGKGIITNWGRRGLESIKLHTLISVQLNNGQILFYLYIFLKFFI